MNPKLLLTILLFTIPFTIIHAEAPPLATSGEILAPEGNPDAIQTVRETVLRTEKRLLLDRATE